MEAPDIIRLAAQASLATLCATAAGLLATDRRARAGGAAVLAAPFALFCLIALSDLADAAGVYAARPGLAGPVYGLALLIPPALHLAVRRLAGDPPEPSGRDVAQLLPALATGIVLTVAFSAHGLAGPVADGLKRAALALFCTSAAVYLLLALRRIARGRADLRDRLSFEGSPAERRLRLALLLLALPLGSLILELAVSRLVAVPEGARLALGLFRMACVAALALAMLRADPLAARSGEIGPETQHRPDTPAQPYARSPLDRAAAERIAAKLHEAMQERRLYRDPFLALGDLSEAIGVPPHRISQVLNREIGLSFFAYVNRWRLEDAARRLAAEPDRTVLAIALEAGFNSKSTFNAAFRRRYGTTPTAWRAANGAPTAD